MLIGTANPMPTLPCVAAGLDLGVDPDHAAVRVDQRAAGVAGVDRRVGLDHVRDREAVGRLDLALQGGDDAAGDGAVEPERVADRDHRVADFDLRGVAERERVQFFRRRVDLEQGDVGGRVGADDFGRVVLVGGAEPDFDLVGAFDDVGVGDDVALGVDQEAGAGRDAAALFFGHAERAEFRWGFLPALA